MSNNVDVSVVVTDGDHVTGNTGVLGVDESSGPVSDKEFLKSF